MYKREHQCGLNKHDVVMVQRLFRLSGKVALAHVLKHEASTRANKMTKLYVTLC